MIRLFRPTFHIASVLELSPARLQQWNLETLLLDVDCTLKRYPQTEVDEEIRRWLAEVQRAGIACCLVSNGKGPRIRAFAEKLGLPYIAKALKPLPSGLKRAMHLLNASPERTAMVGDQLFADIVAGNLARVRTILVEAIHPEEEPWYTRLKRIPEGWMMGRGRGRSV